MRIGIITYHSVYNFGANLQALSTVGYLKNNGFDPVIIDWLPKDLEDGYNKTSPGAQAKAHQHFVKERLPLTELCRDSDGVAKVIKENNIKIVMIGSDAVFQHHTFLSRLKIIHKRLVLQKKKTSLVFPSPFWGSFIDKIDKDIPVVALSASSQNMRYKQVKGRLKREIGNALKKFKTITVRDDWTANMVSYFTNKNIVPDITPDPVFGFNQNVKDYPSKEDILKKFDLPENYVLFSFKRHKVVSDEWIRKCCDILEKDNKTGVVMTVPEGVIFKNPQTKIIAPPLNPIDWYTLIKYSSGYVGENMHPIVVALHNAVPFFSFDSYGIVRFKYFVNEKSSKIYHILEHGGLNKNRITMLGRGYVCPKPEYVMQLLNNFDIEKCKAFSVKQLNNYNKMMEKLTS